MTHRILAALGAVAVTAVLAGSASAACREDLVRTAQDLQRTRAEVEKAADKTPPVKCAAYRQHVAALNGVKTVFARCDTSADKAKNAGQVATTIAAVTRQMQQSCKK
jgi:hypothetical protein